jgi:nucleotide-binding universal stress UspA family protein
MYQKIMVPMDGSELAECVIPHVTAVADGLNPSNVVLVRVVEPYSVPYNDNVDLSFKVIELEKKAENSVDQQHFTEAADYLDGIAAGLQVKGTVEKVVLLGKPADALVDYAAQHGVDLVVISTHGRSGIKRWLRGSVAERILQSICAPVFMVRAPGCTIGL